MPLVHVHLRAGRPALHEYAGGDLESRHGPDAVLVEIVLFPGRTADAKRKLLAAMAANLVTAVVGSTRRRGPDAEERAGWRCDRAGSAGGRCRSRPWRAPP